MELQQVVDSITIPGFTIRLDGHHIHVEQDQPDSADPTKRWRYGEPITVPRDWTVHEVVVRIYCAYQFLLIHEASEQFKVNGLAVFNQHLCPATIKNTRKLLKEERILLWPSETLTVLHSSTSTKRQNAT